MPWYLKRLLLLFPVLFALSILSFLLSKLSGLDAVDYLFSSEELAQLSKQKKADLNLQKDEVRKSFGLNLPVFYLQVKTLNHRELEPNIDVDQQHIINKWAWKGFPTSASSQYFLALVKEVKVKETLHPLLFEENIAVHQSHPEILSSTDLNYKLKNLLAKKSIFLSFIPKVSWHSKNQYHYWLWGNGTKNKGVLRGSFGYSLVKGQKVWDVLASKLRWSFIFGGISTLLALIVGVALGLFMGYPGGSLLKQGMNNLLLFLYAMPSFWLATLLLWTFSNPQMFNVFPLGGLPNPEDSLLKSISYYVLPVICLGYTTAVYTARLIAETLKIELQQLYVTAAESRGIPFKKIVWKHALKNTTIPLITLVGSLLPGIIGGSVIIESIFGLPGIGYEFLISVQAQDQPVVMAVVLILGVFSFLGYWLSDMGYRWADPRINKNEIG